MLFSIRFQKGTYTSSFVYSTECLINPERTQRVKDPFRLSLSPRPKKSRRRQNHKIQVQPIRTRHAKMFCTSRITMSWVTSLSRLALPFACTEHEQSTVYLINSLERKFKATSAKRQNAFAGKSQRVPESAVRRRSSGWAPGQCQPRHRGCWPRPLRGCETPARAASLHRAGRRELAGHRRSPAAARSRLPAPPPPPRPARRLRKALRVQSRHPGAP